MKRTILTALAAILICGGSSALAHDLGGMPHPHPHVGAFATPEGALALVVLLGLSMAATLTVLLSRTGRLDPFNGRGTAGLRRNSRQS